MTVDDTGTIIQSLDYFPFGSERINTGSYQADKTYTNHYSDSETGLLYMGARYYGGGMRRFVSQDPASLYAPGTFLQDPQQLNLYTYARNNPMNYFDPTGLAAEIAQYNPSIRQRVNNYFRDNAYSGTHQMVSGSVPIAGDYIDAHELITGTDFYSGDKLSGGQRALTAVGTALPFVGGRLVRELGSQAVKKFGDMADYANTTGLWSKGRIRNSGKNLEAHFVKHGHEFNVSSAEEYLDLAYKNINDPDFVRITGAHKSGGVDYFNPNTNVVVGLDKDGSVSTMHTVASQRKLNKLQNAANAASSE